MGVGAGVGACILPALVCAPSTLRSHGGTVGEGRLEMMRREL